MPVYESIKNADNKIKISAANRDSAVFGWDKAISFLADKVKAGAKAIAHTMDELFTLLDN